MSTSTDYSSLVKGATDAQAPAKALYEARNAYADKVAQALAQRLFDNSIGYVRRACAFKHDDGSSAKPRAGCFIAFTEPDDTGFYPSCFVKPQPDDGSELPLDPAFADAQGNVFPQEHKPDGGFPKLDGDSHRIPISTVFVGWRREGADLASCHDDLASRGVKSVPIRLAELFSASGTPTDVFLSYKRPGKKFQLAISWDPDRFVAAQNAHFARVAKDNGNPHRDWSYAIHIKSQGLKSSTRPRYNFRKS